MLEEKQPFKAEHSALTEKIISIFYGVANELGFGFMESVYRRAMVIALREAGIASEAEVAIPVWFRGQQVGIFYADLWFSKLSFSS